MTVGLSDKTLFALARLINQGKPLEPRMWDETVALIEKILAEGLDMDQVGIGGGGGGNGVTGGNFGTPLTLSKNMQTLGGINSASMEFASGQLPGVDGLDYEGTNLNELLYWRNYGVRLFRFPFIWERLQEEVDADIGDTPEALIYLGKLDEAVDRAETLSMGILLDMHNYGGRRMKDPVTGWSPLPPTIKIGGVGGPTQANFINVWEQLADRYKAKPWVAFNLMNEPNRMPSQAQWFDDQAAVIAAIRGGGIGATNLIAASGTSFSKVESWVSSGNAAEAIAYTDTNLVWDVHGYFDTDGSGSFLTCTDGTWTRLDPFVTWAEANGHRGILGEFGVSKGGTTQQNVTCGKVLFEVLKRLRDHSGGAGTAWAGWTAWGGGPRWAEDYHLRIGRFNISKPQALGAANPNEVHYTNYYRMFIS